MRKQVSCSTVTAAFNQLLPQSAQQKQRAMLSSAFSFFRLAAINAAQVVSPTIHGPCTIIEARDTARSSGQSCSPQKALAIGPFAPCHPSHCSIRRHSTLHNSPDPCTPVAGCKLLRMPPSTNLCC